MKILICAKNDLAANLACNRLCRDLGDAELTIWLSDVTRPQEQEEPSLATMRFFERDLPNRWIFPLLAAGGPRADGACLTFAELAERHGATLRIVPSLRAPEIAAAMATIDLAISIRFSHLFPHALIRLPRHGILNVHPGALPQYAGLYAPMRQMVDGQAQIGCAVHWIDDGIDTGPVVARGTLPVDGARSLIWHVCHSYDQGVDAVLDVTRELRSGRRPAGRPQDDRQRHYHRLPTPEEFQAFQDKGFRLVAYADYEELLEPYRGTPSDLAGALGATTAARLPA